MVVNVVSFSNITNNGGNGGCLNIRMMADEKQNELNITSSIFKECTSTARGGAIYLSQSTSIDLDIYMSNL